MNKKVNKHTTSKAKLTNTLVDRMPLPVKIPRKGKKPKYTSVVIWDETVPGFYVRKTVSGTATFYLFYRDKERRTKHNLKLGSYPAMTTVKARSTALVELGKVQQNRNPQQEKREAIQKGNLAEYSNVYCAALPVAKSRKKERYIHEKYLRPTLGKYKLEQVKPLDVQLMMNKYESTPYQANYCKVYLHKFYVWCINNQYCNNNPAAGVKNFKTHTRKFVATDTQFAKIQSFLKKRESRQPVECYFIGLMIATGCRPSEISQRRWTDVDWTKKQFVNVDTKTGHRNIELSDTAIDLLKRLKDKTYDISDYCFPSFSNLQPRRSFRKFWYELRDACGLKKTDQMRDLRHHFASITLAETQDMATVSKLLGHSNITTTSKHYAHVLNETERKVLTDTSKKFKVL